MAAPTLNDYEFQFKDAGVGVLLNGGVSVPFWDVENTEGFVGLPDIVSSVYDRDGADGSTVYAKYMNHRVLMIEGTLYANPSAVDATSMLMAASMRPDGNTYPMYFKVPGQSQRFYKAKPVKYNLALDQGRRTGSAHFMLQWLASDPRAYNAAVVEGLVSNVAENIVNSGNVESWPLWRCTASPNTAIVVRIENVTQSRWVQYALTTPGTGSINIELDTYMRRLRIDGIVRPGTFTKSGSDWPSLQPGTNSCKITLTSASSGSIEYQSAWVI